jgi:hypothetical protein
MQNSFFRDDAWQRQVRDAILVPHFYGSARFNGRYMLMDKGRCASVIQRRLSVDTIVQSKTGSAVCIEEKIVRWPGYRYDSLCLETDSCTKRGLESEGWMRYGAADYLLYCFAQKNGDLDCWLIDFPALKGAASYGAGSRSALAAIFSGRPSSRWPRSRLNDDRARHPDRLRAAHRACGFRCLPARPCPRQATRRIRHPGGARLSGASATSQGAGAMTA